MLSNVSKKLNRAGRLVLWCIAVAIDFECVTIIGYSVLVKQFIQITYS